MASTSAVARPHVYPNFYACYLLRSLKPKYKTRTYVGSTPDPPRRIRQHNGELTAGAKKTARYRPWEMICIVHGFPSQLAALQFEWAWQNPHISRQMPQATKDVLHRTRTDRDTSPGQRRRGARGRNRRLRPSLTMAGKLANMHSMLTLDAWRRWPLHVKIFSEDVWTVWNQHSQKKGVVPLPPWMTAEFDQQRQCPEEPRTIEEDSYSMVAMDDKSHTEVGTKKPKKSRQPKKVPKKDKAILTIGGVSNLDLLDRSLRDEQVTKLEHIQQMPKEQLTCGICDESLATVAQSKFIICGESDCHHLSHISCLGEKFLKDEQDALIPVQGKCPGCSNAQQWGKLIKGAQFRHLLQTKGAVDVNEDEFAELELDGQSDCTTSDESVSSSSSSSEGEPLMAKAPRKSSPVMKRIDVLHTESGSSGSSVLIID